MEYRVFVTRTYIACEFIDVVADSPTKARRLAEKAIKKIKPDVRASATDNGWHGDEPTELPNLGYHAGGTAALIEIIPGAYKFAD